MWHNLPMPEPREKWENVQNSSGMNGVTQFGVISVGLRWYAQTSLLRFHIYKGIDRKPKFSIDISLPFVGMGW